MAWLHGIGCCGVAEVRGLTDRCTLKSILASAKAWNKGFLIAYFVKYRGQKGFVAQKLMDKMLRAGWQKSSRPFFNPNSGNVVQPLHYKMKKSERSR